MRTLPKPTDDAVTLFLECVRGYTYVQTRDLRRRLEAGESAIKAAAATFDSAAHSTTLHTISASDTVAGPGTATKEDMVALYESKMVAAPVAFSTTNSCLFLHGGSVLFAASVWSQH
jgi:hypothetical protein